MGRPRFDPRQQQRGIQIRVNHRIRVPEVRVIDADGSMLGVLQTHEALRKAQEQNLDLVEVNPKSDPPVCKILDFGKYKYEEKKKAGEAKRKQTVVDIKEIKLRPKTDDHDLDFKVRAARRFLEAGHKVKFTVRFRGREITHPEKAQEQLTYITQQTEDLSNIETRPMMEARAMTVVIAPKPAIMQKVAQAKIQAEKDRQKAEKEGRVLPPVAESLPSLTELNAGVTAHQRWALITLVLIVPFVGVGVATRVAAPSLGDAMARVVRDAARAIEPPRPRPGATSSKNNRVIAAWNDVVLSSDAGALDSGPPASPGDSAGRGPDGSPAAQDSPRPAAAAAPVGPVRIGADAVQRAIDDDGRTIRARTTRGPDGKPAGARLTGVNGAGLGLRDGDVIVAIDGKPTMDDDAATDAALSAVARGDSVLHVTMTRDGQPFDVVLELPLAAGDAGNRPARR
jgi:translation initiation factor IF-3